MDDDAAVLARDMEILNSIEISATAMKIILSRLWAMPPQARDGWENQGKALQKIVKKMLKTGDPAAVAAALNIRMAAFTDLAHEPFLREWVEPTDAENELSLPMPVIQAMAQEPVVLRAGDLLCFDPESFRQRVLANKAEALRADAAAAARDAATRPPVPTHLTRRPGRGGPRGKGG